MSLYTQSDTEITITTNGLLTIGSNASVSEGSFDNAYGPQQFPILAAFPGTAYVYWQYMQCSGTDNQGIYYQIDNGDTLSVEWLLEDDSTPPVIYQYLINYNASTPGLINFYYFSPIGGGGAATIGVQGMDINDNTQSVAYDNGGDTVVNPGLQLNFDTNPADTQGKSGVDAAPTALIDAGLLTQLSTDLGYDVHHDNQVHTFSSLIPQSDAPYRNMKNPRAVSAVTKALASEVYSHAAAGRLVLTLGGDHSIAIGTIAGTSRAIKERLSREVAVIWVDAHADINTPETSASGNIHGMPVAFLTGLAKEDDDDVFGWLGKEGGRAAEEGGGVLSLKKLVYIGLRDVDRGEKEILRKHGVKAFSMHDIDRHGIGRVMELALGHIGSDTPIHLSFDVDALDPQWAPSTGTPVRGGLTLREGDYIAECVHETGSLVAMDLVEVNPSLEAVGAQETIRAGCSLVRCALGDTLL
ncbi:Arginase, catabolizes arginine to ornithine and urea [Xylographa vitiligo]|nr:Arginase, catabolizes arginine to ornithine and urea [Xylographa vitiligo]